MSRAARAARWVRRNPVIAGGAVGSIALIVATIFVALSVARQREAQVLDEVRRGNLWSARTAAISYLWQLEQFSRTVEQRAADPHLVERLTKLRDGGGLTTSELDVLQRDISSFDPGLLEAGESLGGGGRYGPDTIASIRRREELATLVQEAWDSAPVPLPSELDPTETALGLKFQGVSTSELRVLTTGDAEEARHVARALEAAQ